jgi:hypothetical protein
MRILLAWELGGNLGHLSILGLVARRMREAGHDVLFAVKDVATAHHLLDAEGFRYVQCPQAQGGAKRKRDPVGFADILAGAGFADSRVLFGLVRSWQNLFGLYDPDAVLVQYAPSALVAARLSGIPCLGLHTGFEAPPDIEPFPCFRPWLGLSREKLLEAERVVLGTINDIHRLHGSAGFSRLWQAMKCDSNLLATFPEFDHYQGRTGGRYIGSLFLNDDGVDIRWPDGGDFRAFVYVKPDSGTTLILKTLLDRGASVVAFIPCHDGETMHALRHARLRISPARIRLSSLLPDMDLSVTHANHGTLSALFLAGVQMVTIPTSIEQWMLSACVERLGIGIRCTRARLAAEFPQAVERLCAETAFQAEAARRAVLYAGYDQGHVLDRLMSTIERLPEWSRKNRDAASSGPAADEDRRTNRKGNAA